MILDKELEKFRAYLDYKKLDLFDQIVSNNILDLFYDKSTRMRFASVISFRIRDGIGTEIFFFHLYEKDIK